MTEKHLNASWIIIQIIIWRLLGGMCHQWPHGSYTYVNVKLWTSIGVLSTPLLLRLLFLYEGILVRDIILPTEVSGKTSLDIWRLNIWIELLRFRSCLSFGRLKFLLLWECCSIGWLSIELETWELFRLNAFLRCWADVITDSLKSVGKKVLIFG